MIFEYPDIDPVALQIGPLLIRWYALAYLAGFLLGWRYAMGLAHKASCERPNAQDMDDFLPWAIAGVILGGRLGYVLFYHLGYYAANPLDILKIWEGGMSFHGGVIGVILAMVLFSRARRFPLLRLADIVAACAPIGLFFGRIANFVNGELYGRPTDGSWGMIFPQAGIEPRHPSQLYEAGLEGLVLFIILYLLFRVQSVAERPGTVAGAFLVGYGCFRAVVELFREPDRQIGLIGDAVSMGQILSAPMVVLGLALIVLAFVQREKSHV